eukprot:scaffold43322_cov28-Tisochrysis_lutea.AAC.5
MAAAVAPMRVGILNPWHCAQGIKPTSNRCRFTKVEVGALTSSFTNSPHGVARPERSTSGTSGTEADLSGGSHSPGSNKHASITSCVDSKR